MTNEQKGRFRHLDRQRVNLDGFAFENPDLGLVAFNSPSDPEPSLVVRDGKVVELDGRSEEEFDMIDHFVAMHGLDLAVAEEAMAMPELEFARMLVDFHVPRDEIVRLTAGMTPAKVSRVLECLTPVEMQMAITKMRVRLSSIQGPSRTGWTTPPHRRRRGPAVAWGFRELEATVPVLADASAVAMALLIGSQVSAAGALTQCSVEEAIELGLGIRGLVSYAETVSLYRTEEVFVDRDDTPWSKAFLVSAYASRGIKMRGLQRSRQEVMGHPEGKSMKDYLESAACRWPGRWAQGSQNGGIDGAGLTASVPGGVRGLSARTSR